MENLRNKITEEFPSVKFTFGDVISIAGKVAIEMAFPCVRPAWGGGRQMCNAEGISSTGPLGSIDSREKLQPFLNRYGMTDREMAVLTIGSHAVKNSAFNPWIFNGENSGPKFINTTVNTEWTVDRNGVRPDQGTAFLILLTDNDRRGARLSSDLLFFPQKLADLGVLGDNSFASLEDELKALGEDDFDSEFEKVYAKMLRIGTSNLGPTIANRARGENCPV
jgi:hypothetical protein